MSEYQPGTVAVATVRGVKGVRVLRRSDTHGGPLDWAHCADGVGYSCTRDFDVTDIRPLVVLDLMGHSAEVLGEVLAGAGFADLADQIEAQTKPPRIPEPEFGAVVEAGRNGGPRRRHFIRAYTNPHIGSAPWTDGDVLAKWDDLIDPVLIREGVES